MSTPWPPRSCAGGTCCATPPGSAPRSLTPGDAHRSWARARGHRQGTRGGRRVDLPDARRPPQPPAAAGFRRRARRGAERPAHAQLHVRSCWRGTATHSRGSAVHQPGRLRAPPDSQSTPENSRDTLSRPGSSLYTARTSADPWLGGVRLAWRQCCLAEFRRTARVVSCPEGYGSASTWRLVFHLSAKALCPNSEALRRKSSE